MPETAPELTRLLLLPSQLLATNAPTAGGKNTAAAASSAPASTSPEQTTTGDETPDAVDDGAVKSEDGGEEEMDTDEPSIATASADASAAPASSSAQDEKTQQKEKEGAEESDDSEEEDFEDEDLTPQVSCMMLSRPHRTPLSCLSPFHRYCMRLSCTSCLVLSRPHRVHLSCLAPFHPHCMRLSCTAQFSSGDVNFLLFLSCLCFRAATQLVDILVRLAHTDFQDLEPTDKLRVGCFGSLLCVCVRAHVCPSNPSTSYYVFCCSISIIASGDGRQKGQGQRRARLCVCPELPKLQKLLGEPVPI